MFEEDESIPTSAPANLPVTPAPLPDRPAAPASRPLTPKPQTTGKLTSAAWAAMVLLGLLVASGGAYAYYRIVVLSPANIVRTAIANLQALNSGRVTYELTLTFKPTTGPGGEAPIGADQVHLRADARTDFNRTAEHVQTATEIRYDLTGSATQSLFDEQSIHPSFSLLSPDKQNTFIKLNGIPPLPFIDLTKLNDEWIQVPTSDGAASQLPTGALNITQEEFWRQLGLAYRAHPFLSLQNLPAETIQNVAAYHYKATVDRTQLLAFINQANSTLQSTSTPAMAGDWQSQLKDLEIMAELWVGKADRQLKRALITGSNRAPQGTLEFRVNSSFERANAAVVVAPPANFIPLQEAILRAQPFEGGPVPDDQKTLRDVEAIELVLENYHQDKQQYPFLISSGSRLGVDVVCLGENGFAEALGECRRAGTVYLEAVPTAADSPAHDYRYSLCKEDVYTIEFYLYTDQGEAKAGTNYARFDGISQEPNSSDECADPDQDSLSNYFEAKYKTDPLRPDTDSDGFLDGVEVANGFNPVGAGRLKP